MDHGIRIPSYRRREVSIIVESQSEVSYIVRGILCLHHRSQRNSLYELCLALAFHLVHKGVQSPCRGPLRARRLQLIAELRRELAQVLELLRIRVVVYTVRKRLGLLALRHLAHAFSHSLVSQKHKLLDEFVGILGSFEVAADRLSLLVDVEVQLLCIELHATILEPLAP